ncbi:MAG: hypothetical protein GY699_02295 [Desulfobacteraceae bacterium]|nr:hypothetical protein [Desulfobacteraceae bacterium]
MDIKKVNDPNSLHEARDIIFIKNGETVALRRYHNGKKIISKGDLSFLFRNACEIRIVYKENDNSMPMGVVYLKKNRVIAENIYKDESHISNGKIPDGIIIEKYKNGKINNIIQYKGEKRNGYAISLFSNENLKCETEYLDDFPTGRGRLYYENGNLKTEFEIENRVEKYHREYSINGKLVYE